jgi:hypothetical protein
VLPEILDSDFDSFVKGQVIHEVARWAEEVCKDRPLARMALARIESAFRIDGASELGEPSLSSEGELVIQQYGRRLQEVASELTLKYKQLRRPVQSTRRECTPADARSLHGNGLSERLLNQNRTISRLCHKASP